MDGTTLDLVIKDMCNLMALLCVLGRIIFAQTDYAYMGIYTKLKFKMKLSYECWKKKTSLDRLVIDAI